MIAFFLRGYNDTDHIVPVVWRMMQDGKEVRVICLAPDLDLDGDYRIKFLRAQDISVTYAYDDPILVHGVHRRVLWTVIRAAFAYSRQRIAKGRLLRARVARGCGRRAFQVLKAISFGRGDLDRYLCQHGFAVLCFDWVRPSENIVAQLLAAAVRSNLPTVSLPHGVFLCTNEDIAWNRDPANSIGWRNALADPFDRVVVQYPFFARYLRDGDANAAKALVLGSARYCGEWVKKNIEIVPRLLPAVAHQDPRLKCAFMPTRIQYKIDVARQRTTLERLAALDKAWVVVKPHTRSSLEAELYAGLSLDDVSHISSVELCQWADVILVVASSVMIEALQQNKVVLYLKYLHTNQTLHEEYNDCWIIEGEDELIDALQRLSADLGDVPYDRADTQRFLVDVAEGGVPGRDVLGLYSRAIAGLSRPQ